MASASASALLRASRARFLSPSFCSRALPASSPKPSSFSFASSYRSLTGSSAFRSVPRWSHGVGWRSPLSLRAQIRATAPVIERLHRKYSSMGMSLLLLMAAKIYLDNFLFSSRVRVIRSGCNFLFVRMLFAIVTTVCETI